MKHKAQVALFGLLHDNKINSDYCSDKCMNSHMTCGTYECPQIREDTTKEILLKEFALCQLTIEEVNQIMNCLSVACFDSEQYNSIFNKLKQQKEMWEVE